MLVISIWLAAQLGTAIAAVLVVGRSPTRRTAAAVLFGVGAALPWFSPRDPVLRVALCFIALFALLKAIQIALSRGPWPAWRRIWQLFVLFGVGDARFVTPTVDWRLLGRILLQCAIVGSAFYALDHLRQ